MDADPPTQGVKIARRMTMNVTKRGRLVHLPDGRYAAPNREPAMFDQSEGGEMQTSM